MPRKSSKQNKEPEIEVLPAEDEQAQTLEPVPVEEVEVLPAEDLTEIVTDTPESEAEDSDSRGIVPYDPLSAYLREIRRFPMLSKQEELDLALKYHQAKDLEAARKLISSNLWLVVKLARDYEKAARSILDLIQEGNIGLMEAVKNFDPYRGVRFPSYAVWWIKAYIIRYVMANWRLVKLGTTQAQRKLFFNLKKEKDRLERQGFAPGPKLLAEKLNVRESDIVEMEQRLGSSELSFDAPIQDAPDSNLLGLLPSGQLSAEELLSKKQLKELINEGFDEFSHTLKDKERAIFNERMLAEDKATLQDMADRLSISRERVRQIENRVRDKLRVFLVEKLGPALENIEF